MSHKILKTRYKDLFDDPKKELVELKISSKKHILVFSDSHLDDKFSARRFVQFKRIISKADVIIINGDFWVDSHISFETFLSSKWSALFPLLKQKDTYYIFGNHDMPRHADDRIFKFCNTACFRMKLTTGKIKLHIEHGHLLSSPIIKKIFMIFENNPKLLHIFAYPFGKFEDLAAILLAKYNIPVFQKINNEYKVRRLNVSDPKEYFVMGHTHTPEYDKSSKYINLGFTHGRLFSFLEIFNNKVEQVFF